MFQSILVKPVEVSCMVSSIPIKYKWFAHSSLISNTNCLHTVISPLRETPLA